MADDEIYPRFSLGVFCPKCHGDNILMRWQEGEYPDTRYISRLRRNVGWMNRICAACGYTWREEALDSPLLQSAES